ncbi:MAG: UDP-4-amino-4,6-dideoxy-N-acetyl-beta-L-altrosamine transaminase [Halothiobacillaceae bacterium]
MIPYARQDIQPEDIEAVVDVLRSDYLTQGPMVPRFEQAVADYCGAAHGVATNSATSALHLACLSLGVGPGDLVWTSPITFVASANCARYCGAEVDFVDIDPATVNISPERLSEKLEQARAAGGRLPKVVIPVHFAGQSCDMASIGRLAAEYGFRIIEDASHAIGARYQRAPVGSCRYSDITVFSFHPVKILTTGEGGMAVTNDEALAERMRSLRSHGVTRDPERMVLDCEGAWYYEQIDLGFNYRMTDIQAALGVSQLKRLDAFVSRRRDLVAHYDEMLVDVPVCLSRMLPQSESSHHLYVVRIPSEGRPGRRTRVFDSLREQGVGVNVHYIPLHLQPYYRNLGFATGDFAEAERYYREAITLPLYPRLRPDDLASITRKLSSALRS